MEVTEKEFAIIQEIHRNGMPDQRTIATRTGISLGMTNLIVKRLISQGYIKAKQLNRKKIQYMLTPKGFSEKAKKSYSFTLRTFRHITDIKTKIDYLLTRHVALGETDFTIQGNGEMMDVFSMILKDAAHAGKITFNKAPGESEVPLLIVNGKTATQYDLLNYLAENVH